MCLLVRRKQEAQGRTETERIGRGQQASKWERPYVPYLPGKSTCQLCKEREKRQDCGLHEGQNRGWGLPLKNSEGTVVTRELLAKENDAGHVARREKGQRKEVERNGNEEGA